jgi:[ribosomal protein S5]-alanine N-acetyltransferase
MQRPKFQTERLTLRPFVRTDAARVQLLAGDEKIAVTTLNIPHPYPDGLAEDWISIHEDEFIQRKSLILAVCLENGGKLIGATGLMLKPEHDLGELGYWIGVPYWNHGYCTEAGSSLMEYGFETLKLNKIIAHFFQGNDASKKVLQKLGMKQESYLRRHVKHFGVYKDLIGFAILRDEWKSEKG